MSDVLHCSHLELAAQLRAEGRTVDTLIVDAPYSEDAHVEATITIGERK